jgi:membrane protease YdiL (CAAX protease family)
MISTILKTKNMELRAIWILILLPCLLLAAIFLIDNLQSLLIGIGYNIRGYSFIEGWKATQNLRSKSMEWRTLNLILIAFCYVFTAWFLRRKIEKKRFSLNEMGFKWKRNSFFLLIGGFVIFSCLIIVSQIIAFLRGAVEFDFSQIEFTLSRNVLYGILIYFIYEIINAFSQEILFRGYLQTRMVEDFGPTIGIALTSTYFMALHLLVQSFAITEFIASVFIISFAGLIFHYTKSIYFVGTLHMSISFMIRLFDFFHYKNSNIDITLVFLFAIITSIIIYRRRQVSH